VTRSLTNGAVVVDLGAGEWTVSWPDVGITFGPVTTSVELDGAVDGGDAPDPPGGRWRAETTRTGARARWTAAGGERWCELTVPADGRVVEVRLGFQPRADGRLRRLSFGGPITPAPGAQLVNGYDSWSYAGVRPASAFAAPAADALDCWWSTTVVTDRGALALQAERADRFATAFRRAGDLLHVDAGPTPRHRQLDRTWGFETLAADAAVEVRAGEEVVSEPVTISAGPDPLAVTEALAARVDRREWHGPPACGWESWYHYAIAIDPESLRENAALLRERFGHRPGFDLFQIDDGWQQTYGSWSPNPRFPDGIAALVDEIHALGLRCGLWLAPFMVQPGAIGLGLEHEDWCIRDAGTGATALDRHGRWGLDASHPDVVAFLRELGARVRSWGVDMVKLDFLYLGAQEGIRHDPRVTGTEALRRGLRAFVDPLGDDVYVLGCGAPMLPMVGICHANRIGHDLAVPVVARDFGQPLAEGWSGWHGIKAQARQAAARWALHGRWFHNDPEIVMAWGSDGRGGADGYSLEEAHTQAVVAALTGGPFLLADALAELRPEERAVLEDPAVLDLAWDEHGFRPVDLFAHPDAAPVLHAFAGPTDLPATWVARRGPRTVVALFNWTDAPTTRTAPDGSVVELPPHAARVVPG
jgi:alpha-galactosidase